MSLAALSARSITKAVDELVDVRQYPNMYRWVNRIPITPTDYDEVLLRFKGRVRAADIITEDGKANIYTASPVRLTQTKVPILKHGEGLTRKRMREVSAVVSGQADLGDFDSLDSYLAGVTDRQIKGVYARINMLSVAMLCDTISYNRFGVNLSAVTWGMPSDIKVTLIGAQAWTATATADPIADILALNRTGRQKYGRTYDRITMSTQALLNATACTATQNRMKSLFTTQPIVFPMDDIATMGTIVGRLLNMEVEIDDDQFTEELPSAAEVNTRYMPENKVILSCKMYDGDEDIWRFANVECEEAMMAGQMIPSLIGDFDSERGAYGPLGYMTAASPDANPPGVNCWGLASGFPRKDNESANAVLTAW